MLSRKINFKNFSTQIFPKQVFSTLINQRKFVHIPQFSPKAQENHYRELNITEERINTGAIQ